MKVDIDYEQLQDMLDLKKVEVVQELYNRLTRELAAYGNFTKLLAYAQSTEVTDQLGLTVPPDPTRGSEDGADGGAERTPTEELTIRRRKVMEAMRASLYHATNKLKQYTQQGKDAFAQNRAEMAPAGGADSEE